MVDLDETVMEACSVHLRSVCGKYLDKDRRQGDKYHVITGDALKYMEEHKVSINQSNLKKSNAQKFIRK